MEGVSPSIRLVLTGLAVSLSLPSYCSFRARTADLHPSPHPTPLPQKTRRWQRTPSDSDLRLKEQIPQIDPLIIPFRPSGFLSKCMILQSSLLRPCPHF